MTATLSIAASLLAQGVACIPTHHADSHPGVAKRPKISEWRQFQTGLPTSSDLSKWFADDCSLAIIAGGVTCLDLDTKNAAPGWLAQWDAQVAESGLDQLFARLVCQTTPSGGRHYVWKCAHRVRNLKLAERPSIDPNTGKPKRDTIIETRGDGGYFLAYPSRGYSMTNGAWGAIPTLTAEEQNDLLEFARTFDEIPQQAPAPARVAKLPTEGMAPGEDYNQRGDIDGLLTAHGWTRRGQGPYYTRPGKKQGLSASWNRNQSGHFYCFSSNAHPFNPSESYLPFAVYALLEHGGDYSAAARKLREDGYGEKREERPVTFTADDYPAPDWSGYEDAKPLPVVTAAEAMSEPQAMGWSELMARNLPEPVQFVKGLISEGDIVSFNAPAKGKKSWTILDLAVSIAAGVPFWGFDTKQVPVLVVNLELKDVTFRRRLSAVQKAATGKLEPIALSTMGLRGKSKDLTWLANYVRQYVKETGVKVLIIDPVYKLAGKGSENDEEDVGKFFIGLEDMARATGCAVVFCHHYAKGKSGEKRASERGSGSGVWVRAPDTLVMMTPPDKDDDGSTMTVDYTIRDGLPIAQTHMAWEFPLWKRTAFKPTAESITGPAKGGAPRKLSADALAAIYGECKGVGSPDLFQRIAKQFKCSDRTVRNLWAELKRDKAETLEDLAE